MIRAVVALAVVAVAGPARAESPKLAEARRAIDEVRYDAAELLLAETLHDGGNAPAALGELYQLSARTAVVLGHPELAEPFYRRWLAIDPRAALPADTAPKLRAPFDAARSFMAARPPLSARARRTGDQLAVALTGDPLQMARAVIALDEPALPPVAFGADGVAHLATRTRRVAVVDDDRNQLVVLEPADEPVAPAALAPGSRWQRWTTWAIPAGALAVASTVSVVVAVSAQHRADAYAADSGAHRKADVDDQLHRARGFGVVGGVTGALALGLAIPAAIYYARARREPRVVPTASPTGAGVALTARF